MKTAGTSTLLVLLLLLAACGSQDRSSPASPTRSTSAQSAPAMATASPTTTAPPRGSSVWGGSGIFSVGSAPSHGAKASIPPGRYQISLDDTSLSAVAVVRCSDVPCSESQNFIDGDSGFGASYTSVIDILPTDVAVRLTNAKLTAVEN